MDQKKELLFDEFEIKDVSTTETLKKGKKAFQNQYISNVTLGKHSLKGVYKIGTKEKLVEIIKEKSDLIGYVDKNEMKPFTIPLIALGYWYIDYVFKSKDISSTNYTSQSSLEPFERIQLTLEYDTKHNNVNLSLYQPDTDVYCNEAHLFVYSFTQLIQSFDQKSQMKLVKFQKEYDSAFFYKFSWYKCDVFITNELIDLVKDNVLYSNTHQKIEISEKKVQLKIKSQIVNYQILTSFNWVTDDKSVMIPVHDAISCQKNNFIIYKNKCYQINNLYHAKIAQKFSQSIVQRLDISKIKPFINKLVELKQKVNIELAIDRNIQYLKPIKVEPECIIDVEIKEEYGTLFIAYKYKNVVVKISNNTPYIIFDNFEYTDRNFDLEHHYRDVLFHYHPVKTNPDSITYKVPYIDQVLSDLKLKKIENINLTKQAEKKIVFSNDIIKPQLSFKHEKNGQLVSRVQWLNSKKEKLNMEVDERISLGIESYFDKANNQIIPIEVNSTIKPILLNKQLKIPVGLAIFIILNTEYQVDLPQDINKQVNELKKVNQIKLKPSMVKVLRPFQVDGVRWLISLYKTSFNGILADDMGLGKTVQSIMLLETIYKELNVKVPTIIIMPKTLLFNWKKEFSTFSPSLKVLEYDGQNRKMLIEKFNDYHVILMSYNSIRNDIKDLKKINFHMVILDEAQYVKNFSTHAFKAIKNLSTTHRLLLTGTPVENSIRDIWSLMDIANHNYFGKYNQYEEFFKDENHLLYLKAAISPFIIRRSKKEVLKDLPTVTIQKLWATPSSDELQEYVDFATKEWGLIEKVVEEKGFKESKIHIFSLMTKLRQWCAHPKLISNDFDEGPKWSIFYERLLEAISLGHKVVIFSQFISMIEIIEEKLKEDNIEFITLTGRTRNREKVIEAFNNNPDVRVGVFSLKAGGVGINLTSADYVFLYEPWWNPAVEQQAIDRVHRMGQKNPVMVFKCLVVGTIEERMITYQEQKKKLIDSLIEHQTFSELEVDEIKSLIGI